MQKKVYSVLKPKVSAFGFDKNEVMGIAADIANNLNLNDDATEDEINEAITQKVDAVVPFLKYGQSQANRVINDYKKNANVQTDPKKQEVKEEPTEPTNEMKALMDMMKSMQEKLSSLEAEKATSTRRGKLEKILKDAGAFGKSKLRDFDRMKFDKEEDFESFCEEVEADLKELVQESANDGLSKLSPPQNAVQKKEDVMSDDEIKALAEGM